jgi:hypothetical protein
MFYKIVHQLVAIPSGTILMPADSRTKKIHQQTFRHIFTSKDIYIYSFFPYTVNLYDYLLLYAWTRVNLYDYLLLYAWTRVNLYDYLLLYAWTRVNLYDYLLLYAWTRVNL